MLKRKIWAKCIIIGNVNLVVINALRIDNRSSTRIMGVLNVSPESFYKGSVRTSRYAIESTAKDM
ncbi:MAG: hypothetical protein WBL68_13845, partial [Nitrososphaeraceae archaeon]